MKSIESYITGLLDMASSTSDVIGRSYVQARVFDKKKYIKEFCDSIKFKNIEVEKSKSSLIEIFEDWFGEEHLLATNLNYYITSRVSDVVNIYKLKNSSKVLDELSCRKYGYVYDYEDLYFVEFEKDVICFILGNNE